DFAEMARHRELLAATHARGFDEHDVAAYRCPHQADRNTRLLHALLDFLFRAELRHAEEFAHNFRGYNHLLVFSLRDAPRLLADNRSDFALQIAHAGLAREAMDDFPQPTVRELQLLAHFQPVFGSLLRNQVLVCDVQLFLSGIAG